MDRVGVEPTTSALFKGNSIAYLKSSSFEREKLLKYPPLHFPCSIAHTSNEVLRVGGDLYVNRQIIMAVGYLFVRK
jgi:hypothetical protein